MMKQHVSETSGGAAEGAAAGLVGRLRSRFTLISLGN
jgi:hypothetical protein